MSTFRLNEETGEIVSSFTITLEMVQDMITLFGKKQAIEELTGAAKQWVTQLVDEPSVTIERIDHG
jgi:hypothetical protein